MEGAGDEMAELREHAAARAALFNIGVKETKIADESMPKWPHRPLTADCRSAGAQFPGNQISEPNRGA